MLEGGGTMVGTRRGGQRDTRTLHSERDVHMNTMGQSLRKSERDI